MVDNILVELKKDAPTSLYLGFVGFFVFSAVVQCAIFGIKKGLKSSCGVLLVEYVFFVFLLTVFSRTTDPSWKYNFTPFWSYQEIFEGDLDLLWENLMNVVMFLPVGLLLGITFRSIKWWQVFLIGCSMSLLIEIIQFSMNLGFSEFDDVFHNSLGCLLGYGLNYLVAYFKKRYHDNHASVTI